jgi:hypothetical protein
MPSFNQLTIIITSGIIGFLIVVGIVAMIKPSSHPSRSALPAEVIEHAKTYVNKLGSRPFETLNTNQKLILINAYYNLENYGMVIQHAETMIDELRQLQPERKSAFGEIIENAYRQLGQEHMVTEFETAIDL